MICSTCGNTTYENSSFCRSCGSPIIKTEQPPISGNNAPDRAAEVVQSGSTRCHKCGKEAKVGISFCSGCGTAFIAAADSALRGASGDQVPERKKKPGIKLPIAIAGGIVVVVAAALAIMFLVVPGLSSGGGSSNDSGGRMNNGTSAGNGDSTNAGDSTGSGGSANTGGSTGNGGGTNGGGSNDSAEFGRNDEETPSQTLVPGQRSNVMSDAIRYIDEEIARIESEKAYWLDEAEDALNRLSNISLLIACPNPNDFSLSGAIIDEGVGALLGELLGDVFSFFSIGEAIRGIAMPDDSPVNMIYTVQTIVASAELALKSQVRAGISEDNIYDLLHLAEPVYAYQQALFTNFYIQHREFNLADYWDELLTVQITCHSLPYYNAQLEVLSVAKQNLTEAWSSRNDAIADFADDFEPFRDEYSRLMTNALLLRKAPDSNAGDWEPTDPQFWRANFLLPFLNYDPLRVLALEGRTNRAASIASLIGEMLPAGGGFLSSAYNSLDANGKANISMSILLPNVFYMENAIRQQNNVSFAGDMVLKKVQYCNTLLEKAREDADGPIYAAILQALADADYVEEYLMTELTELTIEITKAIYINNMACSLFTIVLSDDIAGANRMFINGIFGEASTMRSVLWEQDMMKSDGFRDSALDPGTYYISFSRYNLLSGDNAVNRENEEQLNQVRLVYIDTLKRIVDLSMDNNQLDATAQGGSKMEWNTMIGVNGNKIHYDRKTIITGDTKVLKVVQMESTRSSTPRYVCYYNHHGIPVYIEDVSTGKHIYSEFFRLGHNSAAGRYIPDILIRFAGDYDDSDMINELTAWDRMYPDIGVKNDGDVTRELDRLRAG